MALQRTDFDTYRVFLATGGRPTNIFLYAGESLAGQLSFLTDEHLQFKGAEQRRGGTLYLPYPLSRLRAVMDLLRNEHPLHLLFDTTHSTGYLATEGEPVGEAELAALQGV